MALVEVHGVWKAYGPTVVLRDVTFELEAGSMAVVTGRSGSGKSTLFKLLAGLDAPTKGEVLVDGQRVDGLGDAALSELRLRRIGIVFQTLNLLPDLTVHENVRLPLDIAGARRTDAAARADELIALVGLAHARDRRPNGLSGGEAQRAAIARSLANTPALLLADEPTGSLDRANAENVLDVFEAVNRTFGTTVLIVTHDPIAMDRFPARLSIDDGRLRRVQGPGAIQDAV